MKIKFTFKLVIISCLLLITACSEDNSSENNGFFMTANIDGESFNAIPETVLVNYFTDEGDFMTIIGQTANNRVINMIVNLQNYTTGSGTYTKQEVNFVFYIVDPSTGFTIDLWNTNEPGAGNGTLTILEEDDNHLKGTFSFSPFTAFGDLTIFNSSITVSNGSFNAKKN